MTQIILIRHGETDWNKSEAFRGRKDVKLNGRGIEQAKAVAKALADLRLDAVYSSPLARAYETATILSSEHGLEVQTVEGFIDIDFGEWQGLSHQAVKSKYRKAYDDWLQRPHTVKFMNGESLDDLRLRSIDALNDLLAKHKDATIPIVSHRVVLKVLICALLGLDNSHFWQIKHDIGAIATFEYVDDKFILASLNDTCHLKEINGEGKTIDS